MKFNYRKISRTTARNWWKGRRNKVIALCPSNLRIGKPWHPEVVFNISELSYHEFEVACFDKMCIDFWYYNCTDETGNKITFYEVY